MGKVSINVNGRAFAVGCEDGEEEAVAALGRQFDGHVTELAEQVGQIGDLRLFLMAALVLADELREKTGTCEKLRAQVAALKNSHSEGERHQHDATDNAASALHEAADRIEKLVSALATAGQ